VTCRSLPLRSGAGPPSRLDPQVGNRLTVLLFAFCLWAMLILLRLAQFMIFDRDRYLEAMHREAIFEGVVPAARGRILDRDSRVLAWSDRVFAVHWRVPRDAGQASALLALLDTEPWLTATLPHPFPPTALGLRLELARDLPAERAVRLQTLADQVPGLEIAAGFRRHLAPVPGWREYIGRVARGADGTEVGLSGVEREYDDILRGLPGAFQVMLDKDGRWLPETWQKVSELRPGLDVQLPQRVPLREEFSP
jgi:cell division protein FtsI/penicillin-binding protein 2